MAWLKQKGIILEEGTASIDSVYTGYTDKNLCFSQFFLVNNDQQTQAAAFFFFYSTEVYKQCHKKCQAELSHVCCQKICF